MSAGGPGGSSGSSAGIGGGLPSAGGMGIGDPSGFTAQFTNELVNDYSYSDTMRQYDFGHVQGGPPPSAYMQRIGTTMSKRED